MCQYCKGEHASLSFDIYQADDGEWVMDIETGEWSHYDDGFVHERIAINYCPMCGRKLKEDEA